MAEIHSRENPEMKSVTPEKKPPDVVTPRESDKEKLSPKENDSSKASHEKKADNSNECSSHPRLEVKDTSSPSEVGGEHKANEANKNQLKPATDSDAAKRKLVPSDDSANEKNNVDNHNNKDVRTDDLKDKHAKVDNANDKESKTDDPNTKLESETRPDGELSPYAKEKLDSFPNDAPEEIKPAYERACAAEPRITQDMQDTTAGVPSAHLEGLDYRLKDGDSFARKAESISDDKGIPLEDAANNMHDANRYTQVSDGDHLVDNTNNTLAALKDKGYSIDDVNSTWGDDGAYKGINCKLTSPEGQPCELQFHTPESYATKEPMHKLYEEQRQLPETSPEWNAYEDQMRAMSSSLTPPKNIEHLRTNFD